MKSTILFLGFALASQLANGQEKLLDVLPLEEGKVSYSEVVQVEGATQDELYKRAKIWFVNAFRSANDVIQLDDKEGGQIIGKGFSELPWGVLTFFGGQKVNVWYVVNIQVKEGKYRYEITDFWLRYFVPASEYTSAKDVETGIETWNNIEYRPDNSKKFFLEVDETVLALIVSLDKAMTTPAKSDDW